MFETFFVLLENVKEPIKLSNSMAGVPINEVVGRQDVKTKTSIFLIL